MRVAVISDTHGNLTALDAVLAELDATGPYDEILMAGDFAFGGPFPAECIDRIRRRGYRAVRGNTDEFLVEVATDGARPAQGYEEAQGHHGVQLEIDRWVAARLSPEQVDYLAGLPLQVTIPHETAGPLAIVHATPWSAHPPIDPAGPAETVERMLDAAGTRAVAYGHIHIQHERRIDDGLLVAVGSVSMPFDGDPRSAFAVFTAGDDGWTVDLRRVAYDVEKAVAELEASGMPNGAVFAQTLRTGQRP